MAEIKWFGHGCFRVRGREATIVMDPVGRSTGYALPKQKADIVTISHNHPGHNAKGQVQDMVKRLLGLPEPPRPDHAADALAVAICHLNHAPLRERVPA